MGLYNSLFVQCSCGKQLEFQSKAGMHECKAYYDERKLPDDIALDLDGHSQTYECGQTITIESIVMCRTIIQ